MPKAHNRETVKAGLRAQGRTIAEWAAEHGYPAIEVYKVLNGFYKCHRGQAHQIAVDLGLKADPERIAS